jgi:hypothetical protein
MYEYESPYLSANWTKRKMLTLLIALTIWVLVASSSLDGLVDEEVSRGSNNALPASLIKIVKSSTITPFDKSSDLKMAIKQARFTDKSGTDMPALQLEAWQLNPKPISLRKKQTGQFYQTWRCAEDRM